ncbi:hypothetical protein VTH06DRAFT_8681 [Thermothelomyces fergusii]
MRAMQKGRGDLHLQPSVTIRPPTASTGFESAPASEARGRDLEKLFLFPHRFTRIQPAIAATEQWHPPSYHTNDPSTASAATWGLAAFEAAPSMPCAPIFSEPTNDLIPAADHGLTGDYSWGLPTPTSPEYFLEQLSQINRRIHLGGHSLPEPSATIAPWSSAAVNDLLDAACSLADAADRFATGRAVRSQEARGSGERRCALDAALESSTCLSLQACYQALLGVFDHVSAWLLLYLAQPQPPPPQQQQKTPPATPPHPACLAAASCSPQAAVMANLMAHLLSELSRIFLASPVNTHSLQQQQLQLRRRRPHYQQQQQQQQDQQHHEATPSMALGLGMSDPGAAGNPGGRWEPPGLVDSGHSAAWRGLHATCCCSQFSPFPSPPFILRELPPKFMSLISALSGRFMSASTNGILNRNRTRSPL